MTVDRVLGCVLLLAFLQCVLVESTELNEVSARRRNPFLSFASFLPGIYPHGWGWGIAAFVAVVVKGAFWLGVLMIWAFFKGFPGKGGCAPVIIRESVPFEHEHEHISWDPHHRRKKRSATGPGQLPADNDQESMLFFHDMITDLAFSFLGVHSQDCRRRFVCEVDVRANENMLLKMGMRMFGVDIFRKYRFTDDIKATSLQQCAKLYQGCKFRGDSISMNMIFDGTHGPAEDYDEIVAQDDFTEQATMQSVSDHPNT